MIGAGAAIEAAKTGDMEAEEVAAAVLDEQTEEAWLINEDEMKVFVNSERWSLGWQILHIFLFFTDST